jgi:hypothetical protein
VDQCPLVGAGIRLVLDKKSRPAGDRAAPKIVLADAITNTENTCEKQAATLRELRALHLIARFNVQPETAAALALLAFGGAG